MNELHEMHIDVGCYVADALDSDERMAFEGHLAHCESCSREVVEFSETSAELARLVAMAPPRGSRGAMLSAIRSVRPLPPLTDDPASLSSSTDHGAVALSASTRSGGALPSDELAARRSGRGSRRNRVLAGLIAAAAVVALALGGVVYSLTQQRQADFAAQAAATRQNELLSAPDAKVYTATRDGAQYSFVVSKQRNAAFFIGTDLAKPGGDKTYQLWTLQGRTAYPDARVAASAGTQWFTGPISQSTSLAISIEPADGAQQPTPPILAQVTI